MGYPWIIHSYPININSSPTSRSGSPGPSDSEPLSPQSLASVSWWNQHFFSRCFPYGFPMVSPGFWWFFVAKMVMICFLSFFFQNDVAKMVSYGCWTKQHGDWVWCKAQEWWVRVKIFNKMLELRKKLSWS